MKKAFIETVGCPKNQEDSERMAGLLAKSGWAIVFDANEADVIIINTCGFIEAAKRESIETFFDYMPYKADGKRLIVTGCLAQRYGTELAAELTEADAILGVNDYEKLPKLLTGLSYEADNKIASDSLPHIRAGKLLIGGAPDMITIPRKPLAPRYSAYLKIAEGCSNNCAYCAIPMIRGPYRSVPMERLLDEAETLAGQGCRELILIAQDVTVYGADIYKKFMLPELLRAICASGAAKTIEWIRLLYCYEERVTNDLIEVMASEPKILHYIDLPLQHVSNRILQDMRRGSTNSGIYTTIRRLREAMPDIMIRSTFITGLPGETEQEFAELCDFVMEMRFDRLGVFSYSREEGTDAASMPNQVDPEIAEDRRDTIMRIQQQISLEKNAALIGTIQDVIICERDVEDDIFVGRTRGDAPEIDGSVIFSIPNTEGQNDDRIGEVVQVRITDAMDYDLVGELVSEG